MRIAVISDIHGNLAALDAVVADLERRQPDLVVHGGDLAVFGPRPAEVIDRVRALGWQGVAGNWDVEFTSSGSGWAQRVPESLRALLSAVVPWTGEAIGTERAAWLGALPLELREGDLRLVHASPGDLWAAPMPDADEKALLELYDAPGIALAVYAHIHQAFTRPLSGLTVANSGSVGLPYDGDWRPSYLLIDDGTPAVQRVEYDIEREAADLRDSGLPFADWVERSQRTGTFIRPP